MNLTKLIKGAYTLIAAAWFIVLAITSNTDMTVAAIVGIAGIFMFGALIATQVIPKPPEDYIHLLGVSLILLGTPAAIASWLVGDPHSSGIIGSVFGVVAYLASIVLLLAKLRDMVIKKARHSTVPLYPPSDKEIRMRKFLRSMLFGSIILLFATPIGWLFYWRSSDRAAIVANAAILALGLVLGGIAHFRREYSSPQVGQAQYVMLFFSAVSAIVGLYGPFKADALYLYLGMVAFGLVFGGAFVLAGRHAKSQPDPA